MLAESYGSPTPFHWVSHAIRALNRPVSCVTAAKVVLVGGELVLPLGAHIVLDGPTIVLEGWRIVLDGVKTVLNRATVVLTGAKIVTKGSDFSILNSLAESSITLGILSTTAPLNFMHGST